MTAAAPLFERVAIIGVGLIGGSVGKALRAHGLAGRVVGVGSGDDTAQALALGLIDEGAADPVAAVAGADLVIVATPVTTVPAIFEAIAPALAEHALITDCASTKGTVVQAAQRWLGAALSRYVAGHPIAGSEHSGPGAARADLFAGKRWLFSPGPQTQADAPERLMALVARMGARPALLDAGLHDAMFAEYSHAPHALVFALCLAVADGPHADQLADLAGAGFKDTTRIGASSPALWTDILIDNADETVASLQRFAVALAQMSDVLAAGDRAALQSMITRASAWRADVEK